MPTKRSGRSGRSARSSRSSNSSRMNEDEPNSAFTFPFTQAYPPAGQQYAFGVQGSPQSVYPAYTFGQSAFGQAANPYAFGSRVQFPVNPVGSIGFTHAPENYNRRKGHVEPYGPGAPDMVGHSPSGFFRNWQQRQLNPLNLAGKQRQWNNTYMRGGKKRKNKTRRRSI